MKKRLIGLVLLLACISGCFPVLPNFQEITVEESVFEDKFYYEQLAEEEQLVYKELYQGANVYAEEVITHGTDWERVGEIFQYITYDFPELFWIDGAADITTYENSHTVVVPTYVYSAKESAKMKAAIEESAQQILTQIPTETSEYDKIKFVYETLIADVEYVEEALHNQNLYSALVGKQSVCAGYAKANQYLLEQLGIYCIYVVGYADDEGHAWNIVECNGSMYYVDITWADPIKEEETVYVSDEMNYDYLCCSQQTIKDTHRTEEYAYPVCDSEDLNYYRLQGMYYESADRTTLLNTMYADINAKKNITNLKFASKELYEEASRLLIGSLLDQAAEHLCWKYGLREVEYWYEEGETVNRFIIHWNYE